MKLTKRPSLYYDKITTIDNGIKTYTAGKYHWIPMVIEHDVEPQGTHTFAFAEDELWEIADIKVIKKLEDGKWECDYSHARLLHSKYHQTT